MGVPVSFIHYYVTLDISISDVQVLSLGFYSVVPSAALTWAPFPPALRPAHQARGRGGDGDPTPGLPRVAAEIPAI